MRLLTFLSENEEQHVGLLYEDRILDLSIWLAQGAAHSGSGLDMLHLLEMGDAGLRMCREALTESEEKLTTLGALVPLHPARLLAPIPRPRKNVMCLGRNYPDHRAESMRAWNEPPQPPPSFPIFFTKAPTAIAPPYSDLAFDFSISEELDFEAEMGLVIGKRGKNITREEAMDFVLGYVVLNDISVRDVQKRHGNQYFKGKSFDNSCPFGPWIVTKDEVPDPTNLRVWARVNGIEKQNGFTGDMYADVPAIIESLSVGMTLEPGDIIASGTPSGVGMARNPPEWLRPGDLVECEVQGVGAIRNRIMGA